MFKLAPFFSIILFSANVSASLIDDLSDFKGGKIVDSGRITGFIDKDGKIKKSFDGCEYNRKIIIDDRLTVTCQSYKYKYSYQPKAVIIDKGYGSDMLLVVEDEAFKVKSN